jgi:hypothetical protein
LQDEIRRRPNTAEEQERAASGVTSWVSTGSKPSLISF